MTHLRLLDPEFGDTFENAFRRFFPAQALESAQPALKMRIDVSENDKGYTVKADIPGVSKDAINVRVEGNVVSIEAEAKREKEERGNGDKALRTERYYGAIARSFSLAQDIDAAKVEAKYADGVLTLDLPKAAPADSRRIAIR